MEIIDELEPQRRSIYCGSIGYISACGTMDTSITIRTLLVQKNRIYCWAGGGIVADSDIDDEYQESYNKVNNLLQTLEQL
jgi:para-aminobenzoate synthetase component 1